MTSSQAGGDSILSRQTNSIQTTQAVQYWTVGHFTPIYIYSSTVSYNNHSTDRESTGPSKYCQPDRLWKADQHSFTVTTATSTDTATAMTDMAETLAELQLSVSHVKMHAR